MDWAIIHINGQPFGVLAETLDDAADIVAAVHLAALAGYGTLERPVILERIEGV